MKPLIVAAAQASISLCFTKHRKQPSNMRGLNVVVDGSNERDVELLLQQCPNWHIVPVQYAFRKTQRVVAICRW